MKKIREFFRVPTQMEQYLEDVDKLEKEVREDVTPMVLNGEMYLAYQGTPLIKASDLKKDIVKTVEESRSLVMEYNIVDLKKNYGVE